MLYLGFPEDLPKSAVSLRERASGAVRHALESRAWRPRGGEREAAAVIAAICDAVAALPACSCDPAAERPPAAVADPDAHDAYCRVRRTHETGLHVLTCGVLQSYAELLRDVSSGGSSLPPRHWLALQSAYESLLEYLRESVVGVKSRASLPSPVPLVSRDPVTADPLERWIYGHHVFLALIQGLILALNCFASSRAERDDEGAGTALDLATGLMSGASAALHYASDFAPAAYDATVRPTMMPPHVPPGMSGVLARDHSYFVRLLHAQRNAFAALEPPLSTKYERFAAAFAEAYECHKLVCSHFGGGERPSLLNGETAETGIEALEALKRSRLKAFMTADATRTV